MHGEIARVQGTVAAAALLVIAIGLALSVPEIGRILRCVYQRYSGRSLPSRLDLIGDFRFRLRTLLIIVAIGPPIIAWLLYALWRFNWIEVFGYYAGYFLVPAVLMIWIAAFFVAVIFMVVGVPNRHEPKPAKRV